MSGGLGSRTTAPEPLDDMALRVLEEGCGCQEYSNSELDALAEGYLMERAARVAAEEALRRAQHWLNVKNYVMARKVVDAAAVPEENTPDEDAAIQAKHEDDEIERARLR